MSVLNPLNPHQSNQQQNMHKNEDKFKATKMWNEMVYAFYMGISLDKHRRNMRTYYDCFVAREAVSWMHHYLRVNPHFNTLQISRFQALNLLRKFLRSEIIERVNSNCHEGEEYDFQDNKELYKFTTNAHENMPFLIDDSKCTPTYINTATLAPTKDIPKDNATFNVTPVSSRTHQYHYVNQPAFPSSPPKQVVNYHQPSVSQMSELWKQTLLAHLKGMVGPMIEEYIDREQVNPLMLMHNLTRLSENGVVELADKSSDLPHWVMSAMKCLAHWPNAVGTGSCLPKYPGFENDVFQVVKDYFVNSGIPLIPTHLHSLFMAAFDLSRVSNQINNRHSSLRLGKERRYMNLNPTLPVSPIYPSNESHQTSTPVLHQYHSKSPIVGNTDNFVLPPNHVFETLFVGESPITKVVSIDELAHLFEANPRMVYSRSFNGSLPRRRSSGRVNVNVEQNIKKEQQEQGRYVYAVTTMPRKREARKMKLQENEVNPRNKNINNEHHYYNSNNFGFAMTSPTESGEYMMDKSVSLSPSSFHMDDNDDTLSEAMAISVNGAPAASQCDFPRTSTTSDLQFGVSRRTIAALQLSLFLLPTTNRRHLHLLLRLLSKMINNNELHLYIDKRISIKQFLVETFTRSIICAEKEHEYNEMKARQLVIVLLEHCKQLFSVPEALKEEVKRQENQLIEKQVRFDANAIDNNNCNEKEQFCEPISAEEFEMQKHILSHQALADLLMSIVQDKKMSEKDKKRLLKQFKEHHPDVYNWHFPTEEAYVRCIKRTSSSSPQSTPMKSQKSSFLRRILSMRL